MHQNLRRLCATLITQYYRRGSLHLYYLLRNVLLFVVGLNCCVKGQYQYKRRVNKQGCATTNVLIMQLWLGEKAKILGWKFKRSWQAKLEASPKRQSNPSQTVTLVRQVMDSLTTTRVSVGCILMGPLKWRTIRHDSRTIVLLSWHMVRGSVQEVVT